MNNHLNNINKLSVTHDEVREMITRMEQGILHPGDPKIVKALFDNYCLVQNLVDEKAITIKRLLQMVFGVRTEKAKNILKSREENIQDADSGTTTCTSNTPSDSENKKNQVKKKQKGHGRNGVDKYTGAQRICIPHEELQPGDQCPHCEKGKVYRKKHPGTFLHLVGTPPIDATVYEQEKLRCNLCGDTFSAEVPEEAKEKYDETAGSMIGLMKYGCGFPFNRLEKLQENLGVPLPASTQFDIEEKTGDKIYYGFEELKTQAAQADIVYNDDTTMKILSLMRENQECESGDDSDSSRTGIFTTGVIAEKDGRKIALFYTGRNHAGENLDELLKHREPDRGPPIQMCDALARNKPKNFEVYFSNCNIHARRNFVDIAWCFPDECSFVIETYKKVYKHDALTKEQKMSPEERLQFHQKMSKPLMDELKIWLPEQIDSKKVEPNSSLGKAIRYMIKHWDALTQFLEIPGAPLDSNIVERALKMTITNRKNAYFYKTEHGAYIGDMFMSLIHTCNLNGVNPFDYLTQLQRHTKELRENPSAWMPWNYQETLQALAA